MQIYPEALQEVIDAAVSRTDDAKTTAISTANRIYDDAVKEANDTCEAARAEHHSIYLADLSSGNDTYAIFDRSIRGVMDSRDIAVGIAVKFLNMARGNAEGVHNAAHASLAVILDRYRAITAEVDDQALVDAALAEAISALNELS